jgi:arylsulfatase A-like enzyme
MIRSLTLLGVLAAPTLALARPNVVVVVLDTVRADVVSANGAIDGTTPHLDRLAASGLRYTRFYSQSNWTMPAHGALFTGWPPGATGAGLGWQPLGYEWDTLAEILLAAGYQTAAFSENPWLTERMGMTQGFETFEELPRAGGVSGKVAAWLREHRDPRRPVLLFVNIMDAHDPYPVRRENPFLPPWVPLEQVTLLRDTMAELRCNTDGRISDLDLLRRLYLDGVQQADAELGRVLAALEAARLDDLRIVVLSDHGEHFGEQRLVFHDIGVGEALLRVPLVVHGVPGVAPAVIDTPVQTIDVFATVAQWAGVHAAPSPLARPLPMRETGEHRIVFAEYGEAEYAVELFPSFGWVTLAGLIADARRFCRPEDRIRGNRIAVIDFPWKLVWHDAGQRLLYDVAADPTESTDRADAHPEIVARLMDEALRIKSAARPKGGTAPASLDRERAERLRALGYVVGDQ